MDSHLNGKLLAITGAAGGIGRECAASLRAVGAELLLIDRDAEALAALERELGAGPRITCHASSIADPAACAAALAARPGPLYGLVHLAGIFVPDALQPEDRAAVYDPVIAANLTNAYDMCIACLPRFDPAETCRIVLASSLAYRRGSIEYSAYSAAKGGIAGLTRSLARRLAPGVLVNALAPGLIDTPMPADFIARQRQPLLDVIPLKRFGHPREIASVIQFLCDAGSSYITGQVINVDGGVAFD